MRLIANVIKFYEGGIDYRHAKKMGIDELMTLSRYASQINKEIDKG